MPKPFELTTHAQVRTTATSTFLPADAANRAQREYSAWTAIGNVPETGAPTALADYQAKAGGTVRGQAATERAKHISSSAASSGQELVDALTIRQAERAVGDLVIDPGEYPLLEALIDIKGATVALVRDQVLTDRDALETSLGAVEDVLQTALAAIAAATDNTEVDDALAAVSWP
ncbi:MAG: hypothetical protein GY711_18975 [bacterium]|nr:hypothetical protein [bacterium]